MVRKKSLFYKLRHQWQFLVLSVPFILMIILFTYVPLWGWVYSFFEADRQTLMPNFERFLGLEMFKAIYNNHRFWNALRNTMMISIGGLIIGYIASISFAVMLNEVRVKFFKRTVQTVSYLPHFISWVVAATMISVALSPDGGIVNAILLRFGIIDQPINFLIQNSPTIWSVLILTQLWKSLGWNSIIYLAAMSGIDPGLYEAAEMDGAGRMRSIWHITLPGITPIIRILLIISFGHLLRVGFEQYLLMQRALTLDYSEVIDTLAYRVVWGGAGTRLHRDISLGTAIGMMNSFVSIILLFVANKISKVATGERLF
ncbi:MAG: ABC transporter permease subunit [Oscillospiraceae bacterium]|jgi:putative aldouronate transport system permease protein|nr:ABC transporter permease subunit [Oscillospiraceae bacterium]